MCTSSRNSHNARVPISMLACRVSSFLLSKPSSFMKFFVAKMGVLLGSRWFLYRLKVGGSGLYWLTDWGSLRLPGLVCRLGSKHGWMQEVRYERLELKPLSLQHIMYRH